VWFLIVLNLAGKIAALWLGRSAPVTALALWFGPDLVIVYHWLVPRARGLVHMRRRFAAAGREVWLTIDDGPDPDDTPRILEALASHGAKATFFVIGQNAAARPDLIRAMVAAGQEVANHTQTHPLGSFWFASPGRVGREIDQCSQALRAAGVTPTRFRPPAGLKSLWLGRELFARGLTCVAWSARGLERRYNDPEAVADRVLRGLAPGAILLLHEGPRLHPAIRVNAIRRVLERLRDQGYRCVVPTPEQLAD
jgi:peptidoglycan/xylan/chitin deacetylase (PgdA/CDA1 family)